MYKLFSVMIQQVSGTFLCYYILKVQVYYTLAECLIIFSDIFQEYFFPKAENICMIVLDGYAFFPGIGFKLCLGINNFIGQQLFLQIYIGQFCCVFHEYHGYEIPYFYQFSLQLRYKPWSGILKSVHQHITPWYGDRIDFIFIFLSFCSPGIFCHFPIQTTGALWRYVV